MNEISYKKVAEATHEICLKFGDLLNKLNENEYNQLNNWKDQLGRVIPETESPLTIALAGEYDVGKSSIIKALTGKEVLINSNVATSEVKIYDYQGIKLIDMPGTLSGLEIHDKLAFEAAADSDLLMYVISNELFNSSNIKYFKETLENLKKANQCMLVINQIDRINLMDRSLEEAISVIKEELEVRVQPYSLVQFTPVFISARNFIDALDETDEEFKKELIEFSRIDTLIESLNEFCRTHGIIGRLSRPLQSLLALLDSIRNNSKEDNNELDVLNNYFSRQKRIFVECENKIKSKINQLRVEKKREILNISSNVISAFENKLGANEIEAAYQQADDELDELIRNISDEIQDLIKEPIEEMQEKLEEFEHSPVSTEVKQILFNTNIKIGELEFGKKPIKIPDGVKKGIKSGVDDLGKTLSKNADDLAEKFVELYKNVTKTKFKPYGKIKMKDKVGNLLGKSGKVLGWLAIGWDLYCNVKDEVDAENWNKELRNFKAETKGQFLKVANSFEQTLVDTTNEFIKEEIRSKIADIDVKRQELINLDIENKERKASIENLEDEINNALMEINSLV